MTGVNVFSLGVAVLALFLSIVLYAYDRYFLRRRQLTYRIQLDAPMTTDPAIGSMVLRHGRSEVEHPSQVLLSVGNSGALPIEPADLVEGLTISFPGRRVVAVEIPHAYPEVLRKVLLDRLEHDEFSGESEIALPRVPLNRRDRFKLLVLLSGDGDEVHVRGSVRNGRVAPENSRGRTTRLVAVVLAFVFVGALVTTGYDALRRPSSGVRCEAGQLQVLAASDDRDLLRSVAEDYSDACPDAQVTVTQSSPAVRTLRALAEKDPDLAGRAVAFAPETDSGALLVRPVYAVVYVVVVNPSTGVDDLTVEQLRWIQSGRVTNWNQVGGNDLPIRLVGRAAEAGSRRLFEQKVLNGREEPATSGDCLTNHLEPTGPVIRCERATAAEVLRTVEQVPGAIGYARNAGLSGVRTVTIEGEEPGPATLRTGRYPFWAVTNAYTTGVPTGVASALLDFLGGDGAQTKVRDAGLVPCGRADSLC
ncbi:substrate-binding domain-containing protein [Actinosynnema sp. CS-041913]|uniref:substrate-binding domain-containing protein n=1 Tax=Actinosynnema sp. CS-041913 TaxID=3239917 RepID=UPI003D9157D3